MATHRNRRSCDFLHGGGTLAPALGDGLDGLRPRLLGNVLRRLSADVRRRRVLLARRLLEDLIARVGADAPTLDVEQLQHASPNLNRSCLRLRNPNHLREVPLEETLVPVDEQQDAPKHVEDVEEAERSYVQGELPERETRPFRGAILLVAIAMEGVDEALGTSDEEDCKGLLKTTYFET
uniref:Uncharacterized protein n=1 Tax=Steinernema glaseri TaxID=37863 RepID=A0A1I8AGN0_9BILA